MINPFRKPPSAALAVLGFHNLTPTFADPMTNPAFPRRFEAFCRMAARANECVTVTEGVRRLREGRVGKKPMLAIIFDDGYADLLSVAVPILERVGIPATSFVIVGCAETRGIPWYDEVGRVIFATPKSTYSLSHGGETLSWNLPERSVARFGVYWDVIRKLKATFRRELIAEVERSAARHDVEPHDPNSRPMMMSVDDVQEAARRGIEIGCHSITHPILPLVSDDELETEIAGGRKRLEHLIGRPVTSFCFPNGDNDPRCRAVAERSGYEAAVTCALGANFADHLETYGLRRVPMSEKIDAFWPWHTLYRVKFELLSG